MSKSLCELINERPHLNKSSVCKSVGIHRGNFDKYLKAGKFPKKIERALFEELKNYGLLERAAPIIEKTINEQIRVQKAIAAAPLSWEERIRLAELKEREGQ
jgi:hypothetical protein